MAIVIDFLSVMWFEGEEEEGKNYREIWVGRDRVVLRVGGAASGHY